MKTCCRARLSCVVSRPLTSPARRWVSYDKSTLSEEVLSEKLKEGFGDSPDGPKLDIEAQKVQTAAGDLPLSPLFDPKWIASRRRSKKAPAPKHPSGRFRSKVYNNIYARALETPIRSCFATRTKLPRYFMQEFEVVRQPETGKGWWAPGGETFRHLNRDTKLVRDRDDGEDSVEPPVDAGNPVDQPAADSQKSLDEPKGRAPVTVYFANRYRVVDVVSNQKIHPTSGRHGMAVDGGFRTALWRQGMGDVLLKMLRSQATDALIRRATRTEDQNPERFIAPCQDWDKVKDVRLRAAVLWMTGPEDGGSKSYRTLDVDAQYGAKMPVYNMRQLLGDVEFERLKDEAPLFRDSEILVLKQWPSWSMKSLQMLLWRIEGYLAEPIDKGIEP